MARRLRADATCRRVRPLRRRPARPRAPLHEPRAAQDRVGPGLDHRAARRARRRVRRSPKRRSTTRRTGGRSTLRTFAMNYARAPFVTARHRRSSPTSTPNGRARSRDLDVARARTLRGELVCEQRFRVRRRRPSRRQVGPARRAAARAWCDGLRDGHGAMHYLDERSSRRRDQVRVMAYTRRPYPQLHGAFDPHVSILDVIANLGPGAAGGARVAGGAVARGDRLRGHAPRDDPGPRRACAKRSRATGSSCCAGMARAAERPGAAAARARPADRARGARVRRPLPGAGRAGRFDRGYLELVAASSGRPAARVRHGEEPGRVPAADRQRAVCRPVSHAARRAAGRYRSRRERHSHRPLRATTAVSRLGIRSSSTSSAVSTP